MLHLEYFFKRKSLPLISSQILVSLIQCNFIISKESILILLLVENALYQSNIPSNWAYCLLKTKYITRHFRRKNFWIHSVALRELGTEVLLQWMCVAWICDFTMSIKYSQTRCHMNCTLTLYLHKINLTMARWNPWQGCLEKYWK